MKMCFVVVLLLGRSDLMLADGIGRLCDDLEVDPTDIVLVTHDLLLFNAFFDIISNIYFR